VAEGVETTSQLERLLELGCDEMQGYLFSRPLTADAFEDLLVRESMAASRERIAPVLPRREAVALDRR
jgi:EAL domain-containing protein (putative c-di-GMP-specific phosphodiesterase class I)